MRRHPIPPKDWPEVARAIKGDALEAVIARTLYLNRWDRDGFQGLCAAEQHHWMKRARAALRRHGIISREPSRSHGAEETAKVTRPQILQLGD